MTDLDAAIEEGRSLLDDLSPLLAVPLLLSLLDVGKITTTLGHRGGYIGLKFPLPTPVGDLWTFINPPGGVGAGAGPTLPLQTSGGAELLPAVVLGVILYVLVESALTAGYIGSIQQYRQQGTYDFVANVGRYWTQYVVLLAILFGTVVLLLPVLVAVPGLVVLFGIGLLVALYLFWGAWFLVPVADVGAVEALGRSYALATTEDGYRRWTILHLLIGTPLSLVLTTLATTGGPLGLALALAVGLPVGFVLTVASLRVIDGLSGPTVRAPEGPPATESVS